MIPEDRKNPDTVILSRLQGRDTVNLVSANLSGSAISRPRISRMLLYFITNIVFGILVLTLSLTSSRVGHNPALYLILLSLILTSPMIFVKSFSGPYMILVLSVPFFFMMFGFADLTSLLTDIPKIHYVKSNVLISTGELGVLVGLLSMMVGYTMAVRVHRKSASRWLVDEWPTGSILVMGLILFSIGLTSTILTQVLFSGYQVVTMAKVSLIEKNGIVLGRMVGELGEILLSYVAVKTRNKTVLIVVIALMAVKLPLAIILNSKYIGVSFIMTFTIVYWIYNSKLPVKAVLIGGLAISLMFPLAYSYRTYMNQNYASVGKMLEDISGNLEKALSGEVDKQQKVGLAESVLDGMASISGRANMLPSVELIMERVGQDKEYLLGSTLTPVFFILIPRLIYPGKPDAPVGQMFNREFRLSASADTWISTSFLGEFYWNFSWPGILIGMLVIGYTYGSVGALTNLEKKKNVVRLLFILITIAALVFKFQTGIAQQYSVFIRSLLIILFMHLVFRKKGMRNPD